MSNIVITLSEDLAKFIELIRKGDIEKAKELERTIADEVEKLTGRYYDEFLKLGRKEEALALAESTLEWLQTAQQS